MNDIDKLKELSLPDIIQNESGKLIENKTSICPVCEHKGCFKYYPKTNTYNCWSTNGCGSGGTAIDFIIALYGYDQKQAISYLTEKYISSEATDNKPMPVRQHTPTNEPEHKTDSELYFAFYSYLKSLPENKKAIEYLNSRGIFNEVRERYGILTNSPENYHRLNNHFKKTYPTDRLQISGLYNGKGNLRGFANYEVIIPYWNKDKIIYLQSRSITGKEPKYLNIAGQKMPYNLNDVYKAEKSIYIVEGVFDAIAANELGFFAISIGSTTMKPSIYKRLLNLIKRQYLTIIFCADNDEAGKNSIESKNTIEILNYCDTYKIQYDIHNIKTKDHKIKDFNDYLINEINAVKDTGTSERILKRFDKHIKPGTYHINQFGGFSPAQIKQIVKTLITSFYINITFDNDFKTFTIK